MSNIYVDELPKDCWNCEFGYQEHSFDGLRCKFNDKYCNQFKTSCPLKPLSDRLAEERKKVVQEIKSCINDRKQNESCFITRDENGKPITTMATICSNYTINELSYLIKFLDKVEGENNGRDRTNKI